MVRTRSMMKMARPAKTVSPRPARSPSAPGTRANLAPGVASGVFAVVFLCALSALTNMGFAGQESAAQTYFFAMVPKAAVMDLSMVYYFILGGTGAVGAAAEGADAQFYFDRAG